MQDLVIKTGANIPYLLSDNEEKNIIVRVGVQPSDEIRKDFMENCKEVIDYADRRNNDYNTNTRIAC